MLHILNDGTEESFDLAKPVMWQAEFEEFLAQQGARDLEECYGQLSESLLVSRIQNTIRHDSGVVFPADEQ